MSIPAEPAPTADLFADALRRVSAQQLAVNELIEAARQLKLLGQDRQAVDLYKAWVAHNGGHALLHAVYFNYAVSMADLGDLAGAVNALRETIRIRPDFCPPYINLGANLERMGQIDQAVAEWLALVNRLAAVTGDAVTHKIMVLKQIGRVLETSSRDTAAEDILRQSLEINPDQSEVVQHWIALRQRQCKWPLLTGAGQIDRAKLQGGISPLSIACYADDPMFQLATAYQCIRRMFEFPAPTLPPVTEDYQNPRLRIGYVSSDLRAHAVGFAMTDVIETHDRERFEIFAYYCGIPMEDATKARTRQAVEHWQDISRLDDMQVAHQIRADRIDILVDLNGHTKDARTRVFALRPAPIAVNWFGYPGTMGSPYHHYLIADGEIIEPTHEKYYSEKVLRLPCYQPNDRKRLVADRTPSRAEVGLPEQGVVFCCLNGMQKITAMTFQRWMLILRHVPDSVLWLLTGRDETDERLRQAAAAQGVARERVIFADRRANPDHLARYPLADLFLDTMPYGSHTTASDALWMGVPILTLPGRSFASRVCTSLVRAAGLPELVCSSPGDYVRRAIELGQDRAQLAGLKQRLVEGRGRCVLFDTPLLVRSLEDLYRQMHDDLRRGAVPVPDLGNLEIYHEIGMREQLEDVELLSDEAYVARYQERLANWHGVFPIRPDARLWPA